MRNIFVFAIAAAIPSIAASAGELPCVLTQADYIDLANTDSKATPDSVKNMSAQDQEALCETRAYINLIRKKNGDITLADVSDHWYVARFLTKEEKDGLRYAASRALAGAAEPLVKKCLANTNAPECALFLKQ